MRLEAPWPRAPHFAGGGRTKPQTALQKRVDLVVDRSTTGSNSGGFGGRSVDGRPAQRNRQDALDELKHLAKVRVAGSNPVFRSIAAGQRHFYKVGPTRTESPPRLQPAARCAIASSLIVLTIVTLGREPKTQFGTAGRTWCRRIRYLSSASNSSSVSVELQRARENSVGIHRRQ